MCEAVENYAKEYAKEYAESIIAEKEKIEAENKELREKLARYEKEQK